MVKEILSSAEAPAAIGPYAQAVRAGGWVCGSGQLGLDPATGQLAPGGVEAETRQALANIRAVLKAAGLGTDAVVKTTVFMTDLGDFARMNALYGQMFGASPPARSTVQVAALPKGACVEIEFWACAGNGAGGGV